MIVLLLMIETGKVICGRPMIISEAKAAFELATSIY